MMNGSLSGYNQLRQPIRSKSDSCKKPITCLPISVAVEIIKAAFEYVNNDKYFLNENSFAGGGIGSLLRPTNSTSPNSPAPLTSLTNDVRSLIETLCTTSPSSYTRYYRDFESQPQVILGTALYGLRYIETCLWDDVYSDILKSSDVITEDYSQTKQSISSWLVQLNPAVFELTRTILKFLNRYSTSKTKLSNIPSATDLAVVISPYLCRPPKSAFMSIRHQEDLRRIRPLVSFMIERYFDVFTKDLRPKIKTRSLEFELDAADKPAMQDSRSFDIVKQNKMNISRALILPSIATDSLSKDTNSSKSAVVRSPSYSATMDDGQSSSIANDIKSLASFSINHWEIKILEAIVQSTSIQYLRRNYDQLRRNPLILTNTYVTMSTSTMASPDQSPLDSYSDNDDVMVKSPSAREICVTAGVYSYRSLSPGSPGSESPIGAFNALGLNDSPSKFMLSRASSTGSGISAKGFETAKFQDQVKRWSKRREVGLRRRMISDCKAIRVQIMQYEQDFNRKNGRDPKSSERGNMQSVYSTYRDMKRTIRDISAIDIQRFTRSYLVRQKVKKTIESKGFNEAKLVPPRDNHRISTSAATGSDNSTLAIQSTSSETQSLLDLYNELQSQKKEIKRQLKRFDEDFTLANGRTPKKSDKEIMRPLYQTYHDIKAKVEDLKKLVESQIGSVPPDDYKDDDGFGRSISDNAVDDLDEDSKSMEKNLNSNKTRTLEMIEKVVFMRSRSDGSIDTAKSEESVLTSHSLPTTPMVDADRQLTALLEEKKNLHAYLKAYERDFNRTHGRPVTKEEDIHPVANEYQRYKALKHLIRDAKGDC